MHYSICLRTLDFITFISRPNFDEFFFLIKKFEILAHPYCNA